jgi:hypothetical protein
MPELSIRLTREEVRRCLGYGRRGRPSAAVEARLEALWPDAVALLKPRGVFRIVDAGQAVAAGVPSPAETVGIGLCTIGPALENEVRRRSEDGAPLDALVLDSVGSAAAEAAADALNSELCAEAGRRGLFAASRVSPGYAKWPVSSQPALLALLPAAELAIALTPGLMMVPRKSVSFAANLSKEPPPGRSRGRCTRCGLPNCPYSEKNT